MYQKSPKLTSQLAQEIFQLHKDWLMYSWSSYSPEAHKGLGLCMLVMNDLRHIMNNTALVLPKR